MTGEAAAPENNTLIRAKQAINNNEDCDRERISVLLSTISDASKAGQAFHLERETLKTKSDTNTRAIEAAYVELETLLPVNPLGNINIGVV